MSDPNVIISLYETISSRKNGDSEKSYTAKLFSRGRKKITQKLGEEAVETIVAALSETTAEVILESSDLLYHLLVLWADLGIRPEQVFKELERRGKQSGLDEKKSRGKT